MAKNGRLLQKLRTLTNPTRKKLSIYYINLIVLTINFHYKFEVILSWGTAKIANIHQFTVFVLSGRLMFGWELRCDVGVSLINDVK